MSDIIAVCVALPEWMWYSVGLLGAVYFLYTTFLAYTTLIKARDNGNLEKAGPIIQGVGYVIVGLGYVVDILFNIVIGSILFLEPPLPDRLSFTGRCSKHYNDNNFRGKIARWVCDRALDPFQDGGHCSK